MHELRTIAIDDPRRLSVTRHTYVRIHRANTAERIGVLLVVETLGDTGNVKPGSRFSSGFDAAFAKILWQLTIEDHVAWCVCLQHAWVLQKRLNGSTSCLGCE